MGSPRNRQVGRTEGLKAHPPPGQASENPLTTRSGAKFTKPTWTNSKRFVSTQSEPTRAPLFGFGAALTGSSLGMALVGGSGGCFGSPTGTPAVALGVEKKHGNVMNRPPRPVDEGLPNRNDIWLIFYLGAVMVAGTLLVFFLAGGGLETCESLPLSDGTNLPFNQADCEAGVEAEIAKWESYAADKFIHAQTMTLSVFIMFQLFNVMNCRSQEESIFSLGVFSNKAINIAFLVSFALLLFFVQLADFTIPFTSFEIGGLLSTKVLSLNDWGVIIAVAALVVLIEEFRKLIVNSRIFAIDSRR